MSGSDFVFNVALGEVAAMAKLPETTDSLIAVMLKTGGIQTDAAMRDHDTLAVLLAAANDEADFTNYARQALASIVIAIDDTNERKRISCATLDYTAAGGGTNNTIGKVLFCYKPATGSADSAIVPLTAHNVTVTTDGNDFDITMPAGYWYQAS